MDNDIEFINALITYRKEYHQSRKEFDAKQFLSSLFRQFEVKTSKCCTDYLSYNICNEGFAVYDQKIKRFYYDYKKIYSVLVSEFGLNEQKIKELIQCMVDEHLKLGVVTPVLFSAHFQHWWTSI